MSTVGTALGALALILLVAGAWAIALVSGAFDLSLDELEAKYRRPDSKFVELDGVRLHYVDQGRGEPLVMLHASWLNLRAWDGLADALDERYRIVRPDMLMAGLTGEPRDGEYSMERNLRLVRLLADHLGLERFALLGTSSGGIVAFRFAAEHPERVTRLVLINSAGMPRTAATDPNRPRGTALSRWIESHHRSRDFWRESLTQQFTGGTAPPPELVEMVYDMNRRAGLQDAGRRFRSNFATGDPESTLAQVRAPTLILWGMGNITVSHLEADVIEHWLTGAPSLEKKYPKVGHYLYLEIGPQVAQDLRAFLAGELDGDLRVTRRLAPEAPR